MDLHLPLMMYFLNLGAHLVGTFTFAIVSKKANHLELGITQGASGIIVSPSCVGYGFIHNALQTPKFSKSRCTFILVDNQQKAEMRMLPFLN